MPLYLCALRNIVPSSTEQGLEACRQENFTFLKKEKRLSQISVPELDSAYIFSDRKIFHLTDSITDYFYWRDKLEWTMGYDAKFNSKQQPFTLLGKLIDTLFAYDCGVLSTEFREWDALIEHEGCCDTALYTIFRTLLAALDFSKEFGALWYFECSEEEVDEYLQSKKKFVTQTI